MAVRSGVCMGLGIAYAGCDKEEAVELLQVRTISISFSIFFFFLPSLLWPTSVGMFLLCCHSYHPHHTLPPHPPSSLTWMMT